MAAETKALTEIVVSSTDARACHLLSEQRGEKLNNSVEGTGELVAALQWL